MRLRKDGVVRQVVAVSAVVAAMGAALPASAVAADRAPAAIHSYPTWRAAQHGAGFALLKPSDTFGLKLSGKITVNTCPQLHSTWVLAEYAKAHAKPALGIQQIRHNDGCAGNLPPAVKLGTYRVDGAKATLLGVCRLFNNPPCGHLAIERFLVWTKGKISYVVSSFDEKAATVVGFARKLKAAT